VVDVAIAGLGVLAPIGLSPGTMFDAALRGASAVVEAPELAFGDATPLVARVPLDTANVTGAMRNVPVDRATALALLAARDAVGDAGGAAATRGPRTGVYWGTGMGGVHTMEDNYRAIFGAGQWRVKPSTVPAVMPNAPAACIAIELCAQGPVLTYSVACASSAIALGEAALAIRAGRVDCAIAGGSDALLTAPVLAAWTALRSLARRDGANPARSCKPFAADRSGFVLAEAAAALVLERADRARARGATVYAYLAGYGTSCDAANLTNPGSDGQVRAIGAALADARLAAGDIGYINAHGTATRAGDDAEVRAIERALDRAAGHVAVSSTKAIHGHAMGAAGALEFIITVLALHHRAIPPTAHLEHPDPALRLDFVAGSARPGVDFAAAMSHSFAFGGSNAVLVAARCPR
jgi:3-oxoacyl-[acyl-carrier-protein] synthase II